ncbi:MAG TPA: hypothetical protein VKQ52_06460 [Puia sp.]|nr:hypothetical protein [Puia sp.]
MKTRWMVTVVLLLAGQQTFAQDIGSIISAGIKTVIRAVDLSIQRVQTQTIVLQEAQKVVENAMSALELDDIRDWVERQKDLYGEYFQELGEVKSAISAYHRVKEAIQRQEALVAAYQQGLGRFRRDGHFSAAELTQMETVFAGILAESEKNLEQLGKAVGMLVFQMTDQERLAMVDAAADGIDRNYRDLSEFTQQSELLSLQRARDANDYSLLLKLYGL